MIFSSIIFISASIICFSFCAWFVAIRKNNGCIESYNAAWCSGLFGVALMALAAIFAMPPSPQNAVALNSSEYDLVRRCILDSNTCDAVALYEKIMQSRKMD